MCAKEGKEGGMLTVAGDRGGVKCALWEKGKGRKGKGMAGCGERGKVKEEKWRKRPMRNRTREGKRMTRI